MSFSPLDRIFLFLSPLRQGWKEQIDLLRDEYPDIQFITSLDTDDLLSFLPVAEAIVPYRITSEQILNAKKLKIIFIPWSGTDALPLNAIRQSGCIVANTHGNASSVAEHAVTLALASMHRLITYHLDLQSGIWHGFVKGFSETDQWMRLTGKKCAILGMGEIGSLLARILNAGFHCHITGWKKYPTTEPITFFDRITTNLDEALHESEIVFITLPLTESTRHLFNQSNIGLLYGKVVINVGRGSIIEEESLYNTLATQQILYAGVDVWYTYPSDKKESKFPSRFPFHQLPNVVMSPHIGGYSKEGQYQMLLDTMTNIRSYLQTGHPVWKVQLDKGY